MFLFIRLLSVILFSLTGASILSLRITRLETGFPGDGYSPAVSDDAIALPSPSGFRRRMSRVCFRCVSVCWLGMAVWAPTLAGQRFQRSVILLLPERYERLRLHFRLARLTLYLSAYFIEDRLYFMFSVILFRIGTGPYYTFVVAI